MAVLKLGISIVQEPDRSEKDGACSLHLPASLKPSASSPLSSKSPGSIYDKKLDIRASTEITRKHVMCKHYLTLVPKVSNIARLMSSRLFLMIHASYDSWIWILPLLTTSYLALVENRDRVRPATS
ncbi:hypothetical protein NC651_035244 [Populus alba x Populus x berolinensis]|nr:hypothetical protein NC651_035244 [Populus alba x Populus x berolinensis]